MIIERRVNKLSGANEMWLASSGMTTSSLSKHCSSRKIGEEGFLPFGRDVDLSANYAVCWAQGRTVGNGPITAKEILNQLPQNRAHDTVLPCDFVYAGKFRNGAERWWCRTHQRHWGVKADIQAVQSGGPLCCASLHDLMSYVVRPPQLELSKYAEVGIWCSLPAALSTEQIANRTPKIHVHLREAPGEEKLLDRDFDAVSAVYAPAEDLLGHRPFVRVDITPPSAFEFVCGLEEKRDLGCIKCPHCGSPHDDLGEFGREVHRKHFCGNCGRDSTWSKEAIISSSLFLLHDQSRKKLSYIQPERALNLDDFPGRTYSLWASTPAIVWTASRPQEYGIHVHVHEGKERIIDDTFGEVTMNGAKLQRPDLIRAMIARSIV